MEDPKGLKPIPVLFEDDAYVAFNKPPGLLVIPTPAQEKHTLLSIVNRQFILQRKEFRLHPCHRLDRDTSGVILFAKGKKFQQLLMEEFKRQQIKKVYIAFVHGRLKNQMGEIAGEIKDYDQQRFNKKSRAKMAITRYKILELRKGFTVVEVHPITGRTNQIRIQFSEIGHPLVGERKYAFGKDFQVKFRRTALHALKLNFTHPIYKKKITIQSPLAEDMEQFRSQN